MLELRLVEEPTNAALMVYLANEYGSLGDLERAWTWQDRAWLTLRDAIESGSERSWIPVTSLRAMLQLMQADFEGLDYTMGQSAAWAGQTPSGEFARNHPNILHYTGAANEMNAQKELTRHGRLKRLDAAAVAYNRCLQSAQHLWSIEVESGVGGPKTRLRMATTLVQLGYFEEVLKAVGELEASPVDQTACRLLASEALVGLGKFHVALARLIDCDGPGADVLRACANLGLGRFEEAMRWRDAAARNSQVWRSPHRPGLLSGFPTQGGVTPVLSGPIGAGAAEVAHALREVGWTLSHSDLDLTGRRNLELSLQADDGFHMHYSPHGVTEAEAISAVLPRARFLVVVDHTERAATHILSRSRDNADAVPQCSTPEAAHAYLEDFSRCARQEAARLPGRVLEVRRTELITRIPEVERFWGLVSGSLENALSTRR